MKFIFSSIEGRLYEEAYPGRSEIKTPLPPYADTTYVPAEKPSQRREDSERALLYVFEAATYDEAFQKAEALKGFDTLADLYHYQEKDKWRKGIPTDNERTLMAEYRQKKEGAEDGKIR